ncbi:MAG: hypothetical protein KDI82_03320 [Gammaproteobacteria bacterium]|nr:hypothetical protein [Gammaproteobacteria bacterium]
MKFHQLPVGARFAWRGDTWRKTAALTATRDAGTAQQKLVPRSADVTRLADDGAVIDASPELPVKLAGDLVETATWKCVDHVRTVMDGLDPPLSSTQSAALAAALERSAQQMLSTLAGQRSPD